MSVLDSCPRTLREFTAFSFCVCLFVFVPHIYADGCARFDIPAIVESCEIAPEEFAPKEFTAVHPDERLVELTIPCSILIQCKRPQTVAELMIQVRGLSHGFQVIDYQPRTQTYSNIEGPIAIESHRESNHSLGLDASGLVSQSVNLAAKAKTGTSNGKIERYQRLPEQKLLLASGTISRGAGVYYKFLHSDQTTLEGGHDLIITMRVPAIWRGGLLRVDCQASGTKKHLLGSDDDFVAGKQTFVVATYLKGDTHAQQLAQQYSRLESGLRRYAQAWNNKQKKWPHDPLEHVGQIIGYRKSNLPGDWFDYFMLYDTQSIRTKIQPHLPKSLQRATDQFVAARQRLLSLNR